MTTRSAPPPPRGNLHRANVSHPTRLRATPRLSAQIRPQPTTNPQVTATRAGDPRLNDKSQVVRDLSHGKPRNHRSQTRILSGAADHVTSRVKRPVGKSLEQVTVLSRWRHDPLAGCVRPRPIMPLSARSWNRWMPSRSMRGGVLAGRPAAGQRPATPAGPAAAGKGCTCWRQPIGRLARCSRRQVNGKANEITCFALLLEPLEKVNRIRLFYKNDATWTPQLSSTHPSTFSINLAITSDTSPSLNM